MKRDMSLVKQILKHIEKHAPGERGFLPHPDIEGYNSDEVEYHIRLCSQAGFVDLNDTGYIIELTWQGHNTLVDLRAKVM